MKEDASGRRQRAVMATDAEWERIGRAAAESGMDLSRFVIHRALDWDPLPAEVLRRAVREMLVLARLEERRLRGAGALTFKAAKDYETPDDANTDGDYEVIRRLTFLWFTIQPRCLSAACMRRHP